MGNIRVVPRSLTEAYKRREGDFSPNLVGLQFTNGVSLFTFGNFEITTNLDNRLTKNFALGGQWSDYYSLDTLNLSQTQSDILLSNDLFIQLNFDYNNISRYVYFGSFVEFVRVTIEQIIQKWKGSIYLNPNTNTNTPFNTVLSFNYDSSTDIASFLIPKSIITNNFQLTIDSNTDFYNIPEGEIYNLSRDYKKYVIWAGGYNEFPVIAYTGSTTTNPYISIQTKGNPFPSLSANTFGQIVYHLKPNSIEVQSFFEELEDFERVILNRLTLPIYTASFTVPIESDGRYYNTTRRLSWPVTDSYNLDINTREYATYIQGLLEVAGNFDKNKTDLISRRFVSESIHEYDTDGGGNEAYGMKVSKLLKIYGREYDNIKKYVDGISFANVVTYNKLDNTSDNLIKIIAKNLGFDVLLTIGANDFDLLQQVQPALQTPFSGYSRSLSAKELDIELWRRIVINAWWLFKSKGTRKVIEFFLNLFKIPTCMITLDEYVYLVENRLNLDEVVEAINKIYQLSDIDTDIILEDFPIDDYGFPRVLPETNDNYFQMDGFWYNGGNESSLGNNPHIGPYDYGKHYFDQFKCFVPDFNQLLTGSSLVNVNKNYFNNYNEGSFVFDQNGLPVPYYGDIYATVLNESDLVENAIVNSAGLVYFGGENTPKYVVPNGDAYSMKINFTTGKKGYCGDTCELDLTFNADGVVYITSSNKPLTTNITTQFSACCQYYTMADPNAPNKFGFICYWCPPSATSQTITSTGQYIGLLTDNQKLVLAYELGFTGTLDYPTGTKRVDDFLTQVFTQTNFFSTHQLILDLNNNIIVDSACCTLQGGNITLIGNKKFCVKPGHSTDCQDIVTIQIYQGGKEYIIVDKITGLDLTENCCNYFTSQGFNYNWVNNKCVYNTP